VRISLHFSNRLQDRAILVVATILAGLFGALVSGCALISRKRPPAYEVQSIQLRPIPSTDLAAIKAKVAESQAAAAELHGPVGRNDSGE
jgi:hypothetical protein